MTSLIGIQPEPVIDAWLSNYVKRWKNAIAIPYSNMLHHGPYTTTQAISTPTKKNSLLSSLTCV